MNDRLYENARYQKLLAGFFRGNSSSMGSFHGNWMQENPFFPEDLAKLDAALLSSLSNVISNIKKITTCRWKMLL